MQYNYFLLSHEIYNILSFVLGELFNNFHLTATEEEKTRIWMETVVPKLNNKIGASEIINTIKRLIK